MQLKYEKNTIKMQLKIEKNVRKMQLKCGEKCARKSRDQIEKIGIKQ